MLTKSETETHEGSTSREWRIITRLSKLQERLLIEMMVLTVEQVVEDEILIEKDEPEDISAGGPL